MSKWLLLVFFTLSTGNILLAQQTRLEIKGTGASAYLEHVVTPKENFFSVGRMFNVNPKELASFNHLHFASGLNVGQVLKVPLTKTNFTQKEVAGADELLIPLYHSVVAGETLYRLGVNYNKVSLASIKRWNHLASDALTVGSPMIVGFLKVNKQESSLANEQPMTSAPAEPEAKQENPVPPVSNASDEKPQPAPTPSSEPAATQTQTAEAKTKQAVATGATAASSGTNTSGGYFKELYDQQTEGKTTVDKAGAAGVFKSTSGWQDAKYYCFSNDAAAGTVLKITNTTTGKSVYAKVLDAIPDISQNQGLITVISNAASEALGTDQNKFDCKITFVTQ